MNKLEKFISYLSPGWSAERAKARYVATVVDSAYAGASVVSRKMRNWLPARGSADRDYSPGTQNLLIARTRDAYRNQPLARAAIERLKHNVIGTGLRLQSKIARTYLGIDSSETSGFEQKIEREFGLWCKNCDLERSSNFQEIQALSVVSMLISGDVFVNTPYREFFPGDYGLKLQVIEADRVSNPNFGIDTKYMRRGVELSKDGAPSAYWIMTGHPNDIEIAVWEWDRFEVFGPLTGRRRIMHLFEKERPGQTRGVPFLAPILDPLRQLDRYGDAELTAAVVSSLFTVFVETEGGYGLPPSTANTTAPKNEDEVALGPGAVVNLMPGEKINSVDPKRPNTAYDPFVMAIFKQIGAALSLPIEFLTLHFMSSYSASRAAMVQAWKLITYHRQLVIDKFCQPVYELWFDELVSRGKIEHGSLKNYWDDPIVRSAWTRCSWIGPARGAIDEEREVRAARERVELGISTLQIESEVNGVDWLDITGQRQIEHSLRVEAGLEPPVLGSSPSIAGQGQGRVQDQDQVDPDKEEED